AELQAEERVEHTCCDRDSKGVISEREEEILADVAHGRAAESSGARDAAKVSAEKRDAGAFHGDVGARGHGDADVRLREGGRVVDTVACHGDNTAFGLKALHDFRFVAGQNFRVYFLDAKFARNGFRGGAVV